MARPSQVRSNMVKLRNPDIMSVDFQVTGFGIISYYIHICGPCSVVGMATGYGLDGWGIESRWGMRFTAPVQTGHEAHPASCTYNGYRVFPGDRGVTLTPHPLVVPWSRKSRAIPLLPCGLYVLYRAVVPVQGCTLLYLYIHIWNI